MSQPDAFTDELRKIEAAIQAQEGLRGILTDEQIETTLEAQPKTGIFETATANNQRKR